MSGLKSLGNSLLRGAASWLATPDDLHILTISLNVEASPSQVIFELTVKPELRAAAPRSIHKWGFPTDKFKIPDRLRPGQQELPEVPTLPADLIQEIQAHLPADKGTPLWVTFGALAGYLRLVPWDSLLRAAIDRPILRLVDLESKPSNEFANEIDVVLCASEPRAKSPFSEALVLPQIARSILTAKPRDKIRIHVFADGALYPELTDRLSEFGDHVRLYKPPAAAGALTSSRPLPPEITNPWLRWISLSLTRPVDVVHFVCHGYLTAEQGWIALAETPTKNIDEQWSRFVGGGELDPFLVQVGAWSMVLSSPPGNFSSAGLRLLANQMCEDGCRAALQHDLAIDGNCEQLTKAYQFLYHPGPDPAPSGDALSIYCHPSIVKVSTVANAIVRGVTRVLPSKFGFSLPDNVTHAVNETIDKALSNLQKTGGEVPPWLVTTQRYIEQRKLELRRLERVGSDTPEQRRQIEQARDMLTAIERTVASFANKSGGS